MKYKVGDRVVVKNVHGTYVNASLHVGKHGRIVRVTQGASLPYSVLLDTKIFNVALKASNLTKEETK